MCVCWQRRQSCSVGAKRCWREGLVASQCEHLGLAEMKTTTGSRLGRQDGR